MAHCDRDSHKTHIIPTGCNTIVYAFADLNGARHELGSVPVPIDSPRYKFLGPLRNGTQPSQTQSQPAPVQAIVQGAAPLIPTTAIVLAPEVPKAPKRKAKRKKTREPVEPHVIEQSTQYRKIEEKKERHESESRTDTTSNTYTSNNGRARGPATNFPVSTQACTPGPAQQQRTLPPTPPMSSSPGQFRKPPLPIPWCRRCRAQGPFTSVQRQCCTTVNCTNCGPHTNGRRHWTNGSHRRQEAEENARRAGAGQPSMSGACTDHNNHDYEVPEYYPQEFSSSPQANFRPGHARSRGRR
ncbi:hypothetical protein MMC13_003369 [Lambiella insularis]|nr:hypothetical protein [Lambiella insularis]